MAEGDDDETAALKEGPKRDLWMMLGARLVTRGREEDIAGDDGVKTEADATHRRDEVRRTICEFIAEDFATRYKFATLWLNEEWYNDAQLSLEDARRVSIPTFSCCRTRLAPLTSLSLGLSLP